ncbi:MAG: deoxyribonuclease IV [Acidobacteriota bacterium]|nr:deoxyribonuclease IV [Acidobacteriota bacterium]
MQAQASPEGQPVYPATAERGESHGAETARTVRSTPIAGTAEPLAATRRVGAHTSIAGGLAEALDLARRLRCTTLQIFSASPRMWTDGRQKIDPAQAAEFRERRRALELDPVVIHANYLINLAAPDRRLRELSIRGFRGELERAIALAADFLVVHPGSRRDGPVDEAIERIADSLRQAAAGLELGRLRILPEITAGQGSVVGSRVEELRAILDACPELNLGVCLDTAHLLAAGYEIRTEAGLDSTLAEIDRSLGLDLVRVVHVNDSKAPFGSHVDRHEHLGRGHIGLEALRRFVNDPRLAGRAFILETPIDRPGDDWRNVRTLWRLAGIEWARPAGKGDGLRPRKRSQAKQTARPAVKSGGKRRARKTAAKRTSRLKRKR